MKYPTSYVVPDEPCYGLSEMVRMVDGKARWIQAVYVLRNDAIAEWCYDYGPAEGFERVTPIAIPSLGDDSVAQLQEIAEKNRHSDKWAKRAEEMQAESTLIADHMAQLEKDRLQMRNVSVVGPAMRVQRNEYSQERTRRLIKERQRGY